MIEALLHRVPHAVKKDMFRITPGDLEGHDGPVVLEGMGSAGEVLSYRLPRRLVLNGLAVDVAAAREWLRIAVPMTVLLQAERGRGCRQEYGVALPTRAAEDLAQWGA